MNTPLIDRASRGNRVANEWGGVKARPTMHDVAQAAGVSLKTVSRVVNNEPRVRPETAERVAAAIEQLGFHRNDLARSLRPGQSSSTLGLVIGDVGNLFFSGITRAVEEVARDHGYLLVAGSSGEDQAHERELVSTLLARRVEGILLVPAAGDHSFLRKEMAMGIPVVFIDRPPNEVQADAVLFDNREGARRGVTHLIDNGHRRIGLLADNMEIFTAAQRVHGYHDALADAALPIDETLLALECRDVATAEAAVRSLLESPDPPTALFTINNRMSLGALRALRGWRDHVALVGFDDLEFADLLTAPVTLVSNDPYAMGRLAAKVMMARLAGDTSPPREIVLPTTLVTYGQEVAS
jgi:LacI family transcriptional regulator